MGKYDDIINLPHHVSDYHRPMPMRNRAAQFAPFSALSGYEDAIEETLRLTENLKELSDIEKNQLSRKLQFAIKNRSYVRMVYFVPDKKKSGGAYKSIEGKIKKWDESKNIIQIDDGNLIEVDFISEIHISDCDLEF